MGCAVGGAKDGQLRDAQQQVAELRHKVEEREKENSELRRKLEETKILAEHSGTVPPTAAVTLLPGEVANIDDVLDGEQKLTQRPPEAVEDDRELVSELPSNIPAKVPPGLDSKDEDDADDEDEAEPVKTIELQPFVQTLGHDSEASTTAPGALQLASMVCHQCRTEGVETYLDSSDMNRYCETCWESYYGVLPSRSEVPPLVPIEVAVLWPEDRLARAWAEVGLSGWPPPAVIPQQVVGGDGVDGEMWSKINVRVRRDIVGPHARDHVSGNGVPQAGELIAGRYLCKILVGEGHFTKAFLADDLQTGQSVCLKRHRNLSVEALADLFVLGRRMQEVDEGGKFFPQITDAFYDLVGFTVESYVEGQNCFAIAHANPSFFDDMRTLRQVALGALRGLVLLDQAGIVHNDMKADNLIWVGPINAPSSDGKASFLDAMVRIVDFGCARLDQREEFGRNWSLAEGGAGHLGKWSPEMTLRLPITHRSDVWGVSVSLCELHCGRVAWRNEADTAEVVLAESLGLCGLRDGVPSSLLRRSPLDVRLLYTPAPKHLPLRRNALGQLEALQPLHWGLEQVLGAKWRDNRKAEFGELLQCCLIVDPLCRPSAAQVLDCCRFLAPPLRASAATAAAATAAAATAPPPDASTSLEEVGEPLQPQ
mmetsp:Transcript_13405/g.31482  ORF Transcript_13405/g.31482 Transcript_13405/m.31482 type:complete len:653 (+) Transcript_13405:75-2033(+)